jgi:two-component system LytT family sensor kinase
MLDKNDERYKSAQKRVKQLSAFYSSLGSYIVLIIFLFIIDVATGDSWWFYWAAIGFGIAIAVRAWNIFIKGRFGKNWEEDKIRQIMEQEEGVKPKRSLVDEEDYFETKSDA